MSNFSGRGHGYECRSSETFPARWRFREAPVAVPSRHRGRGTALVVIFGFLNTSPSSAGELEKGDPKTGYFRVPETWGSKVTFERSCGRIPLRGPARVADASSGGDITLPEQGCVGKAVAPRRLGVMPRLVAKEVCGSGRPLLRMPAPGICSL